MHFCKECNNMYYIKILDESNKLVYYCRKCGNEDTIADKLSNLCVSKTHIKNKKSKPYTKIINEFTKLDPTLPRVDNIPCPNEECPTNNGKQDDKEVIYIRYDDIDLKFVYLCAHCDTIWKSTNL